LTIDNLLKISPPTDHNFIARRENIPFRLAGATVTIVDTVTLKA